MTESLLTPPVAPDLIVPVQLHALAVSEPESHPGYFQRFGPNFTKMLEEKKAAEPEPGRGTQAPGTGVYLQWQLPEALATAHYDPDTEETTLPLVPNRWLVVRHHRVPSGRPGAGQVRAAAWLIHSDYLEHAHYDSAHGPGEAAFLSDDPETGAQREDWLGRAVDLRVEEWREPANAPDLFLTAAGPGLLAFAGFQPYHPNVFSFHDTLKDLEGYGHNEPAPTTLSYCAIGWYSDDDGDILRRAADIPGLLPPVVKGPADVLRALGWALPGLTDRDDEDEGTDAETAEGPAPGPVRTVYSGTALGIPWDYYETYASARPKDYKPRVAVGHSTGDAFAALTHRRTRSARTAGLVKALYHGSIDSHDLPDGAAELERAAHTATFGASAGGTAWVLVPRPGGGGESLDGPVPAHLIDPPEWLHQLNTDQREFDALTIELAGLRERLRTLWWLKELPGSHPDGFDSEAAAQLDPEADDSPARRAAAVARRLAELALVIPHGTTSEEVEAAIEGFSRTKRLPPELELRRTFEESYHRTSDPVVVVEGAGVGAPLTRDPDDPLPCRTVDGLLETIRAGDEQWAPPAALPPLDLVEETSPLELPVLPAPGRALLAEFALLDRAARTADPDEPGRTVLDTALADPEQRLTGTPAEYTAVWVQPWLPMYLQWDLRYCPAPYQTGDRVNWTFDGERYTWTGEGADPGNGQDGPEWISFANRAFLTPSVPHVLAAQAKRLARTYGQAGAAALTRLRAGLGNLDVLSQTLDGFNDHLLMRDTGARQFTPDDVLPLLGDAGHVAAPGTLNDDARFRFQPLRAGQFYFRDLRIIDRFGRCAVLTAVDGDEHLKFKPVRSAEATPSAPLRENINAPARFVQLPPRLLQEARTRLRLTPTTDGRTAPAPAGPSALSGWLLVNHLDKTLLVYGPDGEPLGELRVIRTSRTEQRTEWTRLPSSPYEHPSDLEAHHPHLAGMVAGLLGPIGPFQALMATINERLGKTTDAGTGDTAVPARLVGRPVAVYRARIDLELKGEPLTNPGWHHALDPEREEYPDYTWPVRLGDPYLLTDGLIGYYAPADGSPERADYSTLYVTAERPADPYLTSIGNGASLALPAREPGKEVSHHITVLADPHNPVHATTGILPVVDLTLPAEHVDTALRRIRAAFRLGPLLAPVRTPAAPEEEERRSGDGEHEGLVMIRPAAWHGEWTWAEPQEEGGAVRWTERPLLAADPEPHPDDPAPQARAGYLMLRPALEEDPA